MKDHYRTLSIPENAKEADIKLAYRRLAKRYHPDVNAGDRLAEERFKEISEAYSVLSDPDLKRAYDQKRLRIDLDPRFTPFYAEPKKEKKDPRRKEYSEADLERARAFHKKRVAAQIARRKKILAGMIITFVIYLCASMAFENYIEEKRKKESEELAKRLAMQDQQEVHVEKTTIEDLDSPYDEIFGEGKFDPVSPDYIVFYNPHSDALICAVESKPPFKTIRNEFVHANNGFVMRNLPDGAYTIKIYRGSDWSVSKRTPDGQKLGGFLKDETFLRVAAPPFKLNGVKGGKKPAHFCDTLFLDTTALKMETISRKDFFDPGLK